MAVIVQMTFSNTFFFRISNVSIKFYLSLFLKLTMSTLVQVMAWCQAGDD